MAEYRTQIGELPRTIRDTRIEARKYLKDVSGQEHPPAFAAFSGSGSEPYHLYSAIGFA